MLLKLKSDGTGHILRHGVLEVQAPHQLSWAGTEFGQTHPLKETEIRTLLWRLPNSPSLFEGGVELDDPIRTDSLPKISSLSLSESTTQRGALQPTKNEPTENAIFRGVGTKVASTLTAMSYS